MTHFADRTDEQLAEDALAGEPLAFRALIERHHDALIRFLIRLTGNRQTAEDVFQETFLQVHQSLAGFDRERRFKPWLFTIAANKGRDALRRQNRRPTVSLSATMPGSDESYVDLMSIDLPPASTRLERQEQSAMVQRALDRLSPMLKEMLLLSYFQKLSYQQIAEMCGVPLGTVKSRLHAAVASFAKSWQKEVIASGKNAGGGSAAAAGSDRT